MLSTPHRFKLKEFTGRLRFINSWLPGKQRVSLLSVFGCMYSQVGHNWWIQKSRIVFVLLYLSSKSLYKLTTLLINWSNQVNRTISRGGANFAALHSTQFTYHVWFLFNRIDDLKVSVGRFLSKFPYKFFRQNSHTLRILSRPIINPFLEVNT